MTGHKIAKYDSVVFNRLWNADSIKHTDGVIEFSFKAVSLERFTISCVYQLTMLSVEIFSADAILDVE